MKILIIDTDSSTLDLAIRFQAYGHEVRVFMRDKKPGIRSSVGDGIIKRVPSWEPHMNWADLIIHSDNNVYVAALEHFRNKGYPIFGPGYKAAQWEQQRDVGEQMLNMVGIKTLPSQTFTKYDEAIKVVIDSGKRFVCKPIGDGGDRKDLSYCAKSPKDLIFMLQKWKKENAHQGKPFILQEFKPGIEMAVGGWFGLSGFSEYWCENWEHKKLMNDDLGVSTGEQGTIVRYTPTSKLAQLVLAPLEGLLHGIGYTGYIDVNCIIDKEGTPWPLEFTMRPGYPLVQIQQSLHRGDPAQWMLDLINGYDTIKVSTKLACGVVVSIPDFPYTTKQDKEYQGYPLFGLKESDVINDIHLCYAKLGKAPTDDGKEEVSYVTAGNWVLVATGLGETVSEASKGAYSTLEKKVELPNDPQWRTDIGCRLDEQLPKLQSMGYALGIKYGE